jgi:hypothetical protein
MMNEKGPENAKQKALYNQGFNVPRNGGVAIFRSVLYKT